jgi:hypothetical protein
VNEEVVPISENENENENEDEKSKDEENGVRRLE